MTAVVVARTYGLPQVDGRHLASLEYRAACAAAMCRIEIDAGNPAGESVAIPSTSLLTFGCSYADEPQLHTARPGSGAGGFSMPT